MKVTTGITILASVFVSAFGQGKWNDDCNKDPRGAVCCKTQKWKFCTQEILPDRTKKFSCKPFGYIELFPACVGRELPGQECVLVAYKRPIACNK
jgi:hypothetical protein